MMQPTSPTKRNASAQAAGAWARRGQIFSIDFVLAIAILSLALAIALQTVDLAQRNAGIYARLQTDNAEMIAQNYTNGTAGFVPATAYCVAYRGDHNTTDQCNAVNFQCASNTFVFRRLIECQSPVKEPCLLEVRTCE